MMNAHIKYRQFSEIDVQAHSHFQLAITAMFLSRSLYGRFYVTIRNWVLQV